MNAVWIMLAVSYGGYLQFGPEFKTKESCEAAVVAMRQSFVEHRNSSLMSPAPPWCARIEK